MQIQLEENKNKLKEELNVKLRMHIKGQRELSKNVFKSKFDN